MENHVEPGQYEALFVSGLMSLPTDTEHVFSIGPVR